MEKMKDLPDDPILEELSGLVSLYIIGQLDDEGRRRLQELGGEYLFSSVDRKRIAQRLKENNEFDYIPAYASFRKEKLSLNGKSKYRRLRIWSGVAAAVLICFGIGLFLELKPVIENTPDMLTSTIIQPGHRKAYITLASGERIELGGGRQTLEESDGTWLVSDSTEIQYSGICGEGSLVYNTLTIPVGGEYLLVLSDGSKVWMNAGSALRYPVRFSGSRRDVFLEGEGYFEIEKDTARPFSVHTSRGIIKVLGTGFNVRDYRDENKVVTTLVHGEVVYQPGNNLDCEVRLHPGYQVEDRGIPGLTSRKVNVEMYAGWKDGKYIFENTTLEEIMQVLSRWYDIAVFYKREEVKQLHFTGDLERYKTINDFLEFLEIGGNVRFTVKGRTITIE